MSERRSPVACPGYGPVDQPQSQTPAASFEGRRLASVTHGALSIAAPRTGQTLAGWTLMAVFDRSGEPVAVFEELAVQEGRIAFIGPHGLIRLSGKSLEPTSEGESGLAHHGIASWYRGHPKTDVLPDRPDVLREELLAGGGDPSLDDVAACYPPARHAFFEGHLRPRTFVGTGISADVVPLYYRDVTMVSRVPIGVVAPGSEAAMEAGTLWEGLIGGWTPLVRTVYPTAPDECWEIVTFASSATANEFKQPVWYRVVRMKAGEAAETRYIDSFLPHPLTGTQLAERFYAELLDTLDYWDTELSGGMTITGWDAINDRSRHAFAREMITRRGNHPKYGIADQAYAGAEHDGFQDVLVSSVMACLE